MNNRNRRLSDIPHPWTMGWRGTLLAACIAAWAFLFMMGAIELTAYLAGVIIMGGGK